MSDYNKSNIKGFNSINIPSVTEPPGIEIYWFRIAENKYSVSRRTHHHTFFEIHFMLRGEISYCFENGRQITVKEKQFILIAPNTPHRIENLSSDMLKFTIAYSHNNSETEQIKDLFFSDITRSITSCIDFCLAESKINSVNSPFLIRNRMFEIICTVQRMCGIQEKKNDKIYSAEDERIIKAKKYISDNMNRFLTCADVASHCYLSTKQLGRIFEKSEGKKLLAYIHDEKIKYAKKLVTSSGESLKQISFNLGFTNEYYFNRFFKSHTGMTPGDYRKSYATNTSDF